MMDPTGAGGMGISFGAGKAGSAFDPIGFLTRQQVILRILCWLFSVIVFGCISNKGWNEEGSKTVCIFNEDGNACRIGSTVGVIGFLGALILLLLEAMFQNISSIKIRRRAVTGDLVFSSLWAVLYLIVFAYLSIAWMKSPYPRFGEGINNARSAVAFSLLSIPCWAGCAYFAYLRWQSGTDMAQFAAGFDAAGNPIPAAQEGYTYTEAGATGADPNAYTGYDQNAAGGAANPFAANPYQSSAY